MDEIGSFFKKKSATEDDLVTFVYYLVKEFHLTPEYIEETLTIPQFIILAQESKKESDKINKKMKK